MTESDSMGGASEFDPLQRELFDVLEAELRH
jgi:hypothetical protein